jgi:hypothetical protein
MRRGWGVFIIGIFIVLVLLLTIFLINKIGVTGEVTKTEITLINTTITTTSNSVENIGYEEKTLLDENQYLERGRFYTQNFIVSQPSKISLTLNSDNPVNYVLLDESQVNRYKDDKSFTSHSLRTRTVFLQDSYNLQPGSYSIIITSLSKPVNFDLIVKSTDL